MATLKKSIPLRPFAILKMAGQISRAGIATLALSAVGFVALVTDERYSGTAYPDPVHGTKVPTIGFGTTQGVKMGDTTTPVKALERALKDVNTFEGALKQCVKVPLHQREYDAYINLSYNIGSTAFCKSSIVKRLNESNYASACDAILLYKYAGGVDCSTPNNRVCSGVWKRRLALHSQCLGN